MSSHFPQATRKRTRSATALPRGGSADSQRPARTLDQLRRECQQLLRTDKLARSMVRRMQDFVVGERVRVQARSSSDAFNEAVEKWVNTWAESFEHTRGRGVTWWCRANIKAALGDGDVLWLKTKDGRVQGVEAERIKNPGLGGIGGTGGVNTRRYRNGVEYDAAGRVVRYHVADWADSEAGAFAESFTRPIGAADAVHMATPSGDELNLSRPEPSLAALIDDFPDLKKYTGSVLTSSIMATYFGLVTETTHPEDMSGLLPGESVQRTDNKSATSAGGRETEVALEPGFMLHLAPGEKASQIDPKQPTTVYNDFVFTNLTMVGAEVGLPVVLWMLDLTKVNFHSARSAIILAYVGFAVWRRWLIDGGGGGGLNELYRWRVALAILRGEIEGLDAASIPDDWDKCEWVFTPPPMLDPLVQAQADAYAIEKGLVTHRDVASARGQDLEEHFAQLEWERKEKLRMGILPAGMPGAVDPNAPAGPAGGTTEDTEEDEGGGEDEDGDER